MVRHHGRPPCPCSSTEEQRSTKPWHAGSTPVRGTRRDVAQLGVRAGLGGRRFESGQPQHGRPDSGGASRRGDGTPFEAGRAQALAVQLRPPPPSGRRPAGRGAPLEAVYSARALGGFESRAFRLGEATRLATGAVLKTVRAQASWVRPPPSPLAGREHDPVNAAGSYPVDQGSNPWRPTNRCVACAGCALGPPKLLVPGSTPGRRTPLPR